MAAKLSPSVTMAAARAIAKSKAPYMAAALYALIPRELPGLGTMGVTKNWLLLWDPEWTAKIGPEQAAWVLLHEVNHVLRDHAGRGERLGATGHMAKVWNIAGDCEINDDLRAMSSKLPEGCFYPETIKEKEGGLAETYYHAMRKQMSEDGQGEGEGEGQPKAGGGWCGSGAGRSQPGEPEQGGGKPGDKPEGADGEGGRTEAESARVRVQVAQAVNVVAAAKGRGSVPIGLQVWASAQLRPAKVPWRSLLARAVRSSIATAAGMVNYSYSRPARRQGALGYGKGFPVMPTLRGPVPSVCVLMDASGSMGQEELTDALSEIDGIMRKAGVPTILFSTFDADSYGIHEVKSVREAARMIKGGGGTDTRPAFAEVEKLGNRKPSTIVVLTDTMIGGAHPELAPSRAKVIWCGVGPHATQCCPWGSFVKVERD